MENTNKNFGNDEVIANQETEEQKEKELKRIHRQHRNMYPVVMKHKNGNLEIIYKDHVELFEKTRNDTFDEEDDDKIDDAYDEIEMCVSNGYRRVRDTTEDDDWRFK